MFPVSIQEAVVGKGISLKPLRVAGHHLLIAKVVFRLEEEPISSQTENDSTSQTGALSILGHCEPEGADTTASPAFPAPRFVFCPRGAQIGRQTPLCAARSALILTNRNPEVGAFFRQEPRDCASPRRGERREIRKLGGAESLPS